MHLVNNYQAGRKGTAVVFITFVGNCVLDELKSLQSDAYSAKLNNILSKNKGFGKLNKVSQILSGDGKINETLALLNMSDILSLKHASVVSCDIERVFSE